MHHSGLIEILVLLAAAIAVVAVFKRLNLSPVLGYLVAGGMIGPHGLAIIQDVESTRTIGEFGVVLLLFYIGLELTLKRLQSMKMHIFGFGGAQVLLTSAAIWAICIVLGLDSRTALIIGGSLALSSTAIVLQILHEQGGGATQVGRLSLATLILQDLAVVPLLVLVPLLANDSGDGNIGYALLDAVVRAAITLAAIIAIGRLFLRPLFRLIGSLKSRELFSATTVLIVLGASFTTEHFGLSLALGAFMAGVMVAETEYVHQVEADIQPFKLLLLGLFFMTVGMNIDFTLLNEKILTITLLAIGLLVGKAIIIAGLCKIFKFSSGIAVRSGFLLSQGGEFAFVIFGLATLQGVMDGPLAQMLLVMVSLTMALTPLLAVVGQRLGDKIDRSDPHVFELGNIEQETKDLERHVIVAGFGRVGRTVCKLLTAQKIPFIALDANPANVHDGRRKGFPVYYGSAERMDVLSSVGVERATMVVVTIRNKKETQKTVEAIRKAFPQMPIVARAWDRNQIKELEESGATLALAEAFEISLQIGAATLRMMAVEQHEIDRVMGHFRAGDYILAGETTSAQISEEMDAKKT